jgi:hypothetical protein
MCVAVVKEGAARLRPYKRGVCAALFRSPFPRDRPHAARAGGRNKLVRVLFMCRRFTPPARFSKVGACPLTGTGRGLASVVVIVIRSRPVAPGQDAGDQLPVAQQMPVAELAELPAR